MTQYPIEHEFPNHDQGRKEAIKALLDGVCLKNAYGTIAAFINNHFRYWNTLDPGWCLLWDSSLIDRGPWTVVEDPSKPKPKKYSEMTPDKQKARLEEVLSWKKVKIISPLRKEYTEYYSQDSGWTIFEQIVIKYALEQDYEVTKGDE